MVIWSIENIHKTRKFVIKIKDLDITVTRRKTMVYSETFGIAILVIQLSKMDTRFNFFLMLLK